MQDLTSINLVFALSILQNKQQCQSTFTLFYVARKPTKQRISANTIKEKYHHVEGERNSGGFLLFGHCNWHIERNRVRQEENILKLCKQI